MPVSKAYLANGGYPPDWPEISRHRREDIAQNQCEWLEPNGERCTRKHLEPIPGNAKGSRTILTTAHLNHDPTDCRIENLRSFCQKHHLTYDGPIHAMHAKMTKYANELEHYDTILFQE